MKISKGSDIIGIVAIFAIVAVMAALSTPNFLETQTRSKVARARADARAMAIALASSPRFNTESYDYHGDQPFASVAANPLSTFSIDVDTASYSNMRRFLRQNTLPPVDAVRIEELVNYFSYGYPEPSGDAPLAVYADADRCYWNPEHRLVRIALKARSLRWDQRPACNLVFLLDTSGSMDEPDKLPLVKRSIKMLIENLSGRDRVAIVTYAGTSGLALPSTSCENPKPALAALESLEPAGSTNGASGIQLAYETAASGLIPGGINRIILATDGDFNVGITDAGSLVRLIQEKARSGITLSVLGFGMGNLKDSNLEKLADNGNGNYAYIDSINEARKALVEQAGGTLLTLAKDVKIQAEFNPARVSGYRLIGYDDRLLNAEDFKDDAKDAGDLGAGHCVTALYEIIPVGAAGEVRAVDPLKYAESKSASGAAESPELMTVKVRYKTPGEEESRQLEVPLIDDGKGPGRAIEDFHFAAAVAEWGMLLRQSKDRGSASPESAASLAAASLGADRYGYRREFLDLIRKASPLLGRGAAKGARRDGTQDDPDHRG